MPRIFGMHLLSRHQVSFSPADFHPPSFTAIQKSGQDIAVVEPHLRFERGFLSSDLAMLIECG